MSDANDIALLREYAGGNSETAFSEIVYRYVNLVYSIAYRFTASREDAEDVTQAVFIILAQKAAVIKPDTVLTGWLYETTRFTAMNFLTGKTRRQAREQKAYMQSTLNDSETGVWRQLAPLLEQAMTRLSEKERTLLALRFFENRTGAETAARMGMNEWAARKRIERAVEKLRKFFMQQGVTVSSVAITGAVSANSVQPAPVGLAKIVSTAAISKGMAASGSTLTLIKGALKVMAWTKAKTTLVVIAGILLTTGTATVAVKEIAAHRGRAWQEKYDLSVLRKVPPQVKILPAIPSRPGGSWGDDSYGGMGLGVSATDIVQCAYGGTLGRMIFSASLPEGQYDFICNVPRNGAKLLQQEIKNKFGLVARRELIETNVLALRIQNPSAVGLRRANRGSVNANRDRGSGSYSCVNQPLSNLVGFLEDYLGTPVVDQTGLKGRFDINLIGDSTQEGLKQVVLKELGLELVPERVPVEFLVIEKAN